MGGVRLGGIAYIVTCSPPMTALGGSGTTGESSVYRSCSTDPPGEMTIIGTTDFADSDQNYNPVLSPDGTKILFQVLGASTGYYEVWVVDNIPGSTPVQLVADASNYVQHPAWGADSDTFVYCHFTGGALVSSAIMKDTVSSPGSPTTVKSATANFGAFRPMFNFDGTRIAYIYQETGGSAICDLRCMDDDGANDASLDNTLTGYLFNDPPGLGWANTQNLIAYSDAAVARNTYVIADDGTGKTQIDANGAASGISTNVSGMTWAPDDSFVVITAGAGGAVYRAEVDGSNTTQLGTDGPANVARFRAALVYQNRIWFISETDASGARGEVRSMALDGTDEVVNFDSTDGTGDQVYPFTGGDGWYFN